MTDKTTQIYQEIDEEINYDIATSGPLAIPPEMKKPGYVYKFVAGDPTTQSYYRKLGHFVVQDETKVGDNRAATSSPFGCAVTVQSRCGTLLVLMAISEKNEKAFGEYTKKRNAAQDAATGKVEGIAAADTYNHLMKR
jgi:hypothetical protein